MTLKYCCTNKACNYPGSTRFEMTFKAETIIDSNNIAATFCPFCKKEMQPVFSKDESCDPAADNQSSNPS
ncbi:MAG: hypothetical protein MI862_11590 [Desulfobacterales bacterium]|nr:hypothetical protein [Desulfobacterales bacterium]